MKQFVKQKFYGKLLRLLKFKRHKKIRTFISFSKKKIEFNPSIHYNAKKNEYFLKKTDSFYKIPIDPLELKNKETQQPLDFNSPHLAAPVSLKGNNTPSHSSPEEKSESKLEKERKKKNCLVKSNFFLKMKQQNKNNKENTNLGIS